MYFLIPLSLLLFFLSGCSTQPQPPVVNPAVTPLQKETHRTLSESKSAKTESKLLTPYIAPESQEKEISYILHKYNPITITIYKLYRKWANIPYRYGGESCEGIDCSAFVQLVYQDGFGISIPRTTEYQAHTGYFVNKSALKEGDLLLFKTGFDSRHAGVYLESGNFLHTSEKVGVTISSIHNPYWKDKYWQARRVFEY